MIRCPQCDAANKGRETCGQCGALLAHEAGEVEPGVSYAELAAARIAWIFQEGCIGRRGSDDCLRAALQAAARVRPPAPATGDGWMPMESAPRDGTRVNLCWREVGGLSAHVELGKYKSSLGWCNTYGHSFHGDPDYWSALPAPPVAAQPAPENMI